MGWWMTRKDVGCRGLGWAGEAESRDRWRAGGSWGSAIAKCKVGTSSRHASHALSCLLPTRRNPDFMCFPFRTRAPADSCLSTGPEWTSQPTRRGHWRLHLSRQNGPKAQGGDKDEHGPWLPELRLSRWGVSLVTVALGSTTAPVPQHQAHGREVVSPLPPFRRSLIRRPRWSSGSWSRRHARSPCCQTRAGLTCESGPSSSTPPRPL